MLDFGNKNTQKQLNKFATCLSKLKPEEFIGLSKMMAVKFYEENDEPNEKGEKLSMRPAEDVIDDMIAKFVEYNRVRRRNLMAILEAAVKGR